jgi:hypothetical protein
VRLGRLADERVERGVGGAGDDDRVTAGQHRDGLDERAGGGLLEQVAEDEHERALGALDAPERRLVVGLDRPGL